MSGDYIEENELVTPAMEKRWAERKALLRVARAAKEYTKAHKGYMSRGKWDKVLETGVKLTDAIKEVEHLL